MSIIIDLISLDNQFVARFTYGGEIDTSSIEVQLIGH